MTLISELCQYPKHRNQSLNVSHLVDMMTNTQDPAKTTTTTKTSQKTSNLSQKYQAAPLGRIKKGSIIQRNIRGNTFQFKFLFLRVDKFKAGNIKKNHNI